MSGPLPTITDEDLHGFVDGELQAERRSAVEAHLANSPVDAERVENWRRQGEITRAAFARVEAEPPPSSILLPSPPRKHMFLCPLRSGAGQNLDGSQNDLARGPGWRNAAGAWGGLAQRRARAALFAIGAGAALTGAFFAGGLHAPEIAANIHTPAATASGAAASDDRLAARTLSALTAFDPQTRAKPADAASGSSPAHSQTTLVVPNLSSAGLTLIGVSPAPIIAGEAADNMLCLFYAKATEPTVALCIARDDKGGAPGFRIAGELSSDAAAKLISWREANAVYALAGPLSEAKLRDLANRVSAEVAAFDAR